MPIRRIAAIAVLAISLAGAPAAAREFSLVSIDPGNAAGVQRIADMGIDIWDTLASRVTAAVTPDQLDRLRKEGFSWSVLYPTRRALEMSMPRIAGPLTVNYRNHDQVVAELQRIAAQYPAIAKLVSLGTTYEGRPIWALKITETVHLDRTVPRVLFCGEHHAREWIAVEVPLRLADHIASNYASDPQLQRKLNQTELWIAPMVNPDGYVYSWTADRWWRKNRKPVGSGYYGVDLNRNYGYQWGGSGSSGDPSSDTYRGPSAFSEKETQALRDLMLARQFRASMSYHNYSQLVLWPWGYTTNPAPDASALSTLGSQMASLIYAVHGYYYTPQQSCQLYLTSGCSDDWFYGVEGVFAYTTEVRPVGYPYFELPPDQIVPTFEENLPAAMKLIDWTDTTSPTVGIEVFTNRADAAFTVTGPATYSGSGTHWMQTGTPNGSYTISYGPVSGWITPIPDTGSVNSSLLTFEGAYTPDYRPIAELKTRADSQPASVQSKIVTAVFNGFFYLEESNRTTAMRVNWPNTPPAEGSLVNVVGAITTSEGERAIQAESVTTAP